MAERNISEDEIREVLSNPDLTRPGNGDSTYYMRLTSTNRDLVVVAIRQPSNPNKYIVKTVFERGND